MANPRHVLSLCDFTGQWPAPYLAAGYRVTSIDLKTTGDLRLINPLDFGPVHGILAAPPCTHFAVSGARWWQSKGPAALLDGLSVVDACLRFVALLRPEWWVLENPVGRLKDYIGLPSFAFHPCDYGDPYTKRTQLWGQFTPPMPVFVGEDLSVAATQGSKMHRCYGGRSERTKTARSITPAGFAEAFFRCNP